jgi:hypothetical protein
MENIVDLIHTQAKEKEMAKERAVKASEFTCVAELVINLRSNPNQLCVRFDKMKDAIAAHAKAVKDWEKGNNTPKFLTISGSVMTSVIAVWTIEAITLIDRGASDRMIHNLNLQMRALQQQ